ncbi:receptor [Ascochyta rabiei]|uniref:Receptor n=2 Tax=Didymella rabiei TaxID=5454 RepID=A0A162YYF7_DIDRA|nr:receptor [Ascochyta rabiei]
MAPSKLSSGSAIIRFYDPDIQAKDALGRTQEQILAWDDNHLENSHNYIQMLFPLPEGSPFNYEAPVIDLDTMKAFRSNGELRKRLRRSFERILTFYGFTTSVHPEVASEDQKDADRVGRQEDTTTETTSKNATATVGSANEDSQTAQASPAEGAPAHDTTTSTTPTETPSVEASAPSEVSSFSYHVVRGPNWRKASRNWCGRFNHNHLRITRILRCLRVLGLQAECDAFFAALKRVYNDSAVSIGARTMEFWTRAVQRPLYIAPDDDEIEWLKTWEAGQQKEQM